MVWPFNKKEERGLAATQSDPRILEVFGVKLGESTITKEQAICVPAVWAALNFLSGTIAGLPLQAFVKTKDGRKPAPDKIGNLVGKNVSDSLSSFAWRYDMFSTGVLLDGRHVTYIERDGNDNPINLFPLIGAKAEMRPNWTKRYYQDLSDGAKKYYDQSDVIDITYMLQRDLVTPRSPIQTCIQAISKAYNATEYGSKVFKNNGLPGYAMEAPVMSGAAAKRAAADLEEAIKETAKNGSVLVLPTGHTLKELGADPEKMQLEATQRFAVEEVARVFQLPPVFLQDLTHGTFSNTEQQDLQLVKHTVKRWCEQLEAEINLKLFGRNSRTYVEFNLDGLMRGDFMSTMQGNAIGIQSGQIAPNETRTRRNLPAMEGGDQLFIQGATVPITKAGENPAQPVGQPDE